MNVRMILAWIGLSTAVALGVTPPTVKPASHAKPAAVAAPKPRLQPKIGAAPKPEFQSGGKTIKIEPNQPGVAAVRSMAPKTFESATRNKAVSTYYQNKINTNAPTKEKLDKLNVGPFRHEFVWWAWYGWAMTDRAWWAWNNYMYFETALWKEWMTDANFASEINRLKKSGKTKKPGLIPDLYVNEPAEAIYNDGYIEAVYNPTPTPPSIVVDGTAGVQLSNLLEGTNRVFGKKTLAIGTLKSELRCYQFLSVPADFHPTYQIEAKRDCDLYVFGPSTTSANDAFGADAAKWTPVPNVITGSGVGIVYRRQVKGGEKNIHLNGVELSLASDQIELFSPATSEAREAMRHVVRDLDKLAGAKDDFVKNNPSLVDYIQETQEMAVKVVTPNDNINDDAVADCHYELNHLRKVVEADVAQETDSHVIGIGRDFVNRIKSLQESLNNVDQLRDPSLADAMPVAETQLAATASGKTDVGPAALPVPKNSTLYLTYKLGRNRADLDFYVNGKPVALPNPGNIMMQVPVDIHPGDVLGFRARSTFTYRSIRFAYVSDKSVLFSSKASASSIAEQGNPNAAPPAKGFAGNAARRGNGDAGQNAGWTAAGLPDAAEWIALPQMNTTYDVAFVVPAFDPKPLAEKPAVQADNAPAAAVDITKLLPVGSVWKPTPGSSNPRATMTVTAVTSSQVEFTYQAGDGKKLPWVFEVNPDAKLNLKMMGDQPAPDRQITGMVSDSGFTVEGPGLPNGFLKKYINLNMKRQQP